MSTPEVIIEPEVPELSLEERVTNLEQVVMQLTEPDSQRASWAGFAAYRKSMRHREAVALQSKADREN